jgi:hypothetical protein
MRNLINHFFKNNSEEILKKSLKNCHVKGVHSIMLSEAPGKTIRLYIATEDHNLYKRSGLQVAFHPHHCNITIDVISGSIDNWMIVLDDRGDILLDKYLYRSKILEGGMSFELIETDLFFETALIDTINKGESAFMKADQLHTINIKRGERAAWFVYEGLEDVNYQPYCYSDIDPKTIDTTDFYKPFENLEEINHLLKTIY